VKCGVVGNETEVADGDVYEMMFVASPGKNEEDKKVEVLSQ
jgi:hypothetical protein